MQPIFVGRQPIFDDQENLVGFELLFRAGHMDTASVTDGDLATSDLLRSAFIDIGLEHLVGEHLAFVNLTRGFLEHDVITSLPPEQVVLEILEDVEIDAEVVAAVRRLKARGFRIALDDYQFQESHAELVELADLVKLDVLTLGRERLAQEVDTLRGFGVELLAEKVETAEDYARCRHLGFSLFQGFHLSFPHVIEGQRLESLELALLRLLKALQAPDPTPAELERLIAAEPGLAIQLLRLANSPAYRGRRRTDSLYDAILRLGQGRIKRLAMLMVLRGADGQSHGLEQVMIRARMGMLMARALGLPPEECERYFTLGMLSGLDRVLGVPLRRILGELHLSTEMEQALLEGSGPLAPLLATIAAFEGPALPPDSANAPVPAPVSSRLYLEAVRWTEDLLASLAEP
ncbi:MULTISPECIES: EAL and HDOD domain-containing protein [unclassified Thioalkalivibrio]|uniref:EAL and HDOD domain-containing protein n=1 Tax=unclassified Thioalkalivibrio TaxID=2621013 RepID=UPI00037FE06F|nr:MULTISPECIES: HDOD domain-containing protein [unclassified Thioalkalivibrio]